MLTYFWTGFFAGLIALAFVAGFSLRIRLRRRIRSTGPVVDDDAVRAILDTGLLTTDEDEPLDLDDIAEEERRFWEAGPYEIEDIADAERRFLSESRDEPDEW